MVAPLADSVDNPDVAIGTCWVDRTVGLGSAGFETDTSVVKEETVAGSFVKLSEGEGAVVGCSVKGAVAWRSVEGATAGASVTDVVASSVVGNSVGTGVVSSPENKNKIY